MAHITLRNVTLRLGDELLFERLNLSLEVSNGLTLIIGPNGSGKSTLLKLISGLILPDEGEVEILGVKLSDSMSRKDISRLRREVKLMLQEVDNQLITSRVLDEVLFGLLKLGMSMDSALERAETYLKRFDLWDIKDRDPNELSYGQKTRLLLASLLAMKPRVLALDEPEANLDPLGKREMLELIEDVVTEHMIIWVTHDLSVIKGVLESLRGSLRYVLRFERALGVRSLQLISGADAEGVLNQLDEHPIYLLAKEVDV